MPTATTVSAAVKSHPGATIGIILAGILGGFFLICFVFAKVMLYRTRHHPRYRRASDSSAHVVQPAFTRAPMWPDADDISMSDYIHEVHWNIPVTPMASVENFRNHRESQARSPFAAQEHSESHIQFPEQVHVVKSTVPKHMSVNSRIGRPRSYSAVFEKDSNSDVSSDAMNWQHHRSLGRSDPKMKGVKRARTLAKLEGNHPETAVETDLTRRHIVAMKSSAYRLSAIAVMQARENTNVGVPKPLQIGRKPTQVGLRRVPGNAELHTEMHSALDERGEMAQDKRSSFLEAVLGAGEADSEFSFTFE